LNTEEKRGACLGVAPVELKDGKLLMMKFSHSGVRFVIVIFVLASVRMVFGAINGFTTWEQGGRTNTIQSGDFISLSMVQGTASNIYSDTIRFTVGTGNSMTNNLLLTGSSYYNLPDGTVTNGFYNGKVFDIDPLVTYAFTNFSASYFEGRMGLNALPGTFGTGLVATVTFQGYNPGPTNLVVPVIISAITVGRSGGWWGNPGQWATIDINYGSSRDTYVRILSSPSPGVVAIAHDAGNATVTLTATLDPGTSNVVLYCTELGGSESPAANIVIPMDAPDKVTTNITGLPAPGQKGFWRIRSIREGSVAQGSPSVSQAQPKTSSVRKSKR
jgi:hypothetical protein